MNAFVILELAVNCVEFDIIVCIDYSFAACLCMLLSNAMWFSKMYTLFIRIALYLSG